MINYQHIVIVDDVRQDIIALSPIVFISKIISNTDIINLLNTPINLKLDLLPIEFNDTYTTYSRCLDFLEGNGDLNNIARTCMPVDWNNNNAYFIKDDQDVDIMKLGESLHSTNKIGAHNINQITGCFVSLESNCEILLHSIQYIKFIMAQTILNCESSIPNINIAKSNLSLIFKLDDIYTALLGKLSIYSNHLNEKLHRASNHSRGLIMGNVNKVLNFGNLSSIFKNISTLFIVTSMGTFMILLLFIGLLLTPIILLCYILGQKFNINRATNILDLLKTTFTEGAETFSTTIQQSLASTA